MPGPPSPAAVQEIQLDTIDNFGALWSEMLFVNRSYETCSIYFDPQQVAPFHAPEQSKVSLDGWGRYLRIVSGSKGFGADSDLLLTLSRRQDVLREIVN